MKSICFFTAMVLLLLVGSVSAQNEDGVIIETDYWLRLAESERILRSQNPADAAAELRTLWQDVRAVELADGTIIALDTTWLQPDPNSFNDDLASTLQNRIRALIEFQAQRSGLSPEELLARLEELMKDYQFTPRQPPPTTASSGNTPNAPNRVSLPDQLFQGILMIIGIIAVMAVVYYFTRNLRLQAATLEGDKADDIPATSADADDLADASVASRDYRAAIRYLYLSSLLLLDERGVINFDPNLTNLEHLRQVRNRPPLNELLTAIVDVFDHVWYGFAPVDETMFLRFRENVNQLKQIQP